MNIIDEFMVLGRGVCCAAMLAMCLGCSPSETPGIDTSTQADATDSEDMTIDSSDMGPDTSPATCTSHAECDDGIDCTEDLCTVAGTCTHNPDDGECAAGEHCSITDGCITGCSTDADCDDGQWCNGEENCFGTTCVPSSTPRSCDDGNPCTIDYCNEDTDSCDYDLYPECESDAPTDSLAGDAFDPEVHYNGLFNITPTISQECGSTSYYITQASFTNSGGTLTVTMSPFTLTGTSPADASFSVSGSYGCLDATFSGDFSNSDNFIGYWSAVKVGTCMCSNQTETVGGIRN